MPLDRKDLKIQALLEKISNLTTTYENQIADLRVDLTVVDSERSDESQALNAEIDRLNAVVAELQGDSSEDVSSEED